MLTSMLSGKKETHVTAVETEQRSKPISAVLYRLEDGKKKTARLFWDTEYESLVLRFQKAFDIDAKDFQETREVDRKIYTKTPKFRLRVKRQLYCPFEVTASRTKGGSQTDEDGLPNYNKEYDIVETKKEWRIVFEQFPRGSPKQMAASADFLYEKLKHPYYTWRLDGGLGFWELAQAAHTNGVATGVFSEGMLELMLEHMKAPHSEEACAEAGIYSTSCSGWATMWWLLNLAGMAVRGKEATPGAGFGNANKLMKKAALWRQNAKKNLNATTHAATSHQQKKKAAKQAHVMSGAIQQTAALMIQTSWDGHLGWLISHDIFKICVDTQNHILSKVEEHGESYLRLWRSDLSVVNLGYSMGVLKKLLSYTSVASHLRLHNEYACEDGDILPETERSYPGSTPRIRGKTEDPDEKPKTDTLGVEVAVLWQSLYKVASMPPWICSKPGDPEVEPMSLQDAYIRLKRTAKARKMRKSLQEELALQRKLAIKEAEMRKESEDKSKKKAVGRGSTRLTLSPNNPFVMAEVEKLGAANTKPKVARADTMERRRKIYTLDPAALEGSSMEGQRLGVRAPGIMAAEMIMDQIQRGGDDNLMSFNESVGVGSLAVLLTSSVPMRARHCAAVVLASYSRSSPGLAILRDSKSFFNFIGPLLTLATLPCFEGEAGVSNWRNGDRRLLKAMDFGSPISEHAAVAVWGLAKGMCHKATRVATARAYLADKKLRFQAKMTENQAEAEMKELSKALTGIIQCCVDTSIGGEDIEINSSASFLAAAGAVLAKNNALIEILMDLRIVDDGCVKPKIDELAGLTPLERRRAKRKMKAEQQKQEELEFEQQQAEDALEMLDSYRSDETSPTHEAKPIKIDTSLEPGAINRMMASPVLGALEAGTAIIGLIAERSVPKTGGLQGIYREKLLESGAWPLLAEAVTETSFETARLEESVAAALMYLAVEVPYIITRDPPSNVNPKSQEWTPEHLNKPLRKLDLWIFTRGHGTLDTALGIYRELLGSEVLDTLHYAAIGVWLLARCKGLRGPLGEGGCIEALVQALRRWYELNPQDRIQNAHVGEWLMNAICLVCTIPTNLERFCAAYKPRPPKDLALLQLEQFKKDAMENQLQQVENMGGPVTPHATLTAQWKPFGWADTEEEKDDSAASKLNRQSSAARFLNEIDGFDASIASKDPVQLCVQVLLMKARTAAVFKKPKLQAIHMLKALIRHQEHRQRLVDMGAGAKIWGLVFSTDPAFDWAIKSGAAYIWILTAASQEGKATSWWKDFDSRIDSIIEDDPAKQKVGATYGQAMLAITLMKESDNHAQRVGTHAAAFLTGESHRSKAIFLELGGVDAAVATARESLSDMTTTLAAVVFNNISSCVPYQKELCDKGLFLILDTKQRYERKGGVAGLQLSEFGVGDSFSMETPTARTMNILRATSGALWNLSRNPANRSAFYKAELKYHTLQSLEDLKETNLEDYMACKEYARTVEDTRRHKHAATGDREKFSASAGVRKAIQSGNGNDETADGFISTYNRRRTISAASDNKGANKNEDEQKKAGNKEAGKSEPGKPKAGAVEKPGASQPKISSIMNGMSTATALGSLLQKARTREIAQKPGVKPTGLQQRLQAAGGIWEEMVVDRHDGPVVMMPLEDRSRAAQDSPRAKQPQRLRQTVKNAANATSIASKLNTLRDLDKKPGEVQDDMAASGGHALVSKLPLHDVLNGEPSATSMLSSNLTADNSQYTLSVEPSSSISHISQSHDATFKNEPHRKSCTRWEPSIVAFRVEPADGNEPVVVPAGMSGFQQEEPFSIFAKETEQPTGSWLETSQGTFTASARSPSPPEQSPRKTPGLSAPRSPPSRATCTMPSFDDLPAQWAQSMAKATSLVPALEETSKLTVAIKDGNKARPVTFKTDQLKSTKSANGMSHRIVSEEQDLTDTEKARDVAKSANWNKHLQKQRPSSSGPATTPFSTTAARFQEGGNFKDTVMPDHTYRDPVTEFQDMKLEMWATVPGSKVFDHMPKTTLPDGSKAIVYTGRKTRVDELQVGWPDMSPATTNFFDLGHKGLPGYTTTGNGILPRAEILHKCAELPYVPRPPKIPDLEPVKAFRTKRIPDYSRGMTVSLEEWIEITNEQDVADPDDYDDPTWKPKKTSVFWKRKAESDMKSLTEHEKGIARIFELDWLACTKRPTFMEQLGKNLTVEKQDNLFKELREGFKPHYLHIINLYSYYCQTSDDFFKFNRQDLSQFLKEFRLVNEEVDGVRTEDFHGHFAGINPVLAEETDINTEYSLFRSEFFELIVRITKTKYMYGKRPITKSWTDAIRMLFEEHLFSPELQSMEFTFNRNVFRKERLYKKPVNVYFKKHSKLFKALFDHFKTHLKKTALYLSYASWELLLSKGGLLNDFFSPREALLCFSWSRHFKFDDTAKRPKVTGMTYIDFLEGLGRVADMANPPSIVDLRRQKYNSDQPTYEYYYKVFHTQSGAPPLPDRQSMELTAPKTRPLQHKLQQIMEVITSTMMNEHGLKSLDDLQLWLTNGGVLKRPTSPTKRHKSHKKIPAADK